MHVARWVFLIVVVGILARFPVAAEAAAPADAPAALLAAIDRLAAVLSDWRVHHIDQQPSVTVEGQRAYRIILRRTWKEPPPGTVAQQQAAAPSRGDDDPTYLTKHTDWHFVLVPLGNPRLSAQAKREILWHVPDEQFFRLPVAMGEGHGFAWFSYITIPMQHLLRDQLTLIGGDDRLELAVRGLSVHDQGMNTRNTMTRLFVQFGDDGFAALNRLITTQDDPSEAIHCLVYFRDAKATRRLMELYHWPNKHIHRAAAYALVHRPFRPEAKETYLDLLRQRLHVHEALQACLEFDWQDALPLIEAIVERPSSLGAFRDAYQAQRQLSGHPLDTQLLAAASVIRRQSSRDPSSHPTADELAMARRTIVESADVEGAVFLAASLATFVTKANTTPVNRDGVQLLRALPRPAVDAVLDRLQHGVEDDSRPLVLEALLQEFHR